MVISPEHIFTTMEQILWSKIAGSRDIYIKTFLIHFGRLVHKMAGTIYIRIKIVLPFIPTSNSYSIIKNNNNNKNAWQWAFLSVILFAFS